MTPFLPEKTVFIYVISVIELQEDGPDIRFQKKQVSGIMEYRKRQKLKDMK